MVWLQRYIADLGRAWPVLVVCGGIAPLLLSVTWLILVRYFVGVITWLTIILLNVFTLLVTLFFYIKGMTKALWFSPPFWCLIEFKVYCFEVCNSIQLLVPCLLGHRSNAMTGCCYLSSWMDWQGCSHSCSWLWCQQCLVIFHNCEYQSFYRWISKFYVGAPCLKISSNTPLHLMMLLYVGMMWLTYLYQCWILLHVIDSITAVDLF